MALTGYCIVTGPSKAARQRPFGVSQASAESAAQWQSQNIGAETPWLNSYAVVDEQMND